MILCNFNFKATLKMSSQQSTEEATICIDVSGSVGGFGAYWYTVQTVCDSYAAKYAKVNYILWDSECEHATEAQVREFIAKQTGRNGTEPSNIVKGLKHLKVHNNICIITDGEVNEHDVSKCDQLLKKYDIDDVECHIVNRNPNLSVTCPFTRGNSCKVFTYVVDRTTAYEFSANGVKIECVLNVNKEDYALVHSIETLSWDTICEKFEDIKRMLLSLNMGTNGNTVLKDKLVKCKRNVIQEFARRATQSQPDYNKTIRTLLDNNNMQTEEAINVATTMTKAYFNSDANIGEVNRKFDQLISLCGDLRRTFSTNVIASNQASRADNVEDKELVVDASSKETTEFVCPVLLDNDWPGILIDETKPILFDVEKDLVEFILECPLRLLKVPALVDKCKKVINQMIGLQHYGEYDGKNPYTRNRLLGVIPLGTTQNHIEVGNYTMSCLFTDKKQLGNSNLWFCVVYMIAKQLPYLEEHQEHIERHLRYRLANTTTYASLTGLVTLVTTKVSTDIALWYILASHAYQHNAASDPIRFHMPHIQYIRELVAFLFSEQSISPKFDKYIALLRWILSSLSYVKQSPKHAQFLKRAQQALYQNHLVLRPTVTQPSTQVPVVVILDERLDTINTNSNMNVGNAPSILATIQEQVKVHEPISTAHMYNIFEQVSPNKSASDIPVPSTDDTSLHPPLEVKNVWKWEQTQINSLDYVIPICYATFRPQSVYFDEELQREVSWKESALQRYKYKSPTTDFPCLKYFLMFIIRYNQVPTREAFVAFCYEKKGQLPCCITEMYDSLMVDYKPSFARAQEEGKSIADIVNVLKLSVDTTKRAKMEQQPNVFGGGLL